MSEPEEFRLDIQRTPVEELDPGDVRATRRWVTTYLLNRALHGGRVRPSLLYVGDGWVEEVDLTKVIEIGREAMIARFFVALGQQRPGVRRRFRIGEALVRDDQGRMRRAVGLLEHSPELEGDAERTGGKEGEVRGRWWLSWTFAGQGQDGRGVLHGAAWTEAEGEDVGEIPEGFREWLELGHAELERLEQRAKPSEETLPDVRTAIAQLLHPLPEEPGPLAGAIGGMIREELQQQGLRCLLVFAVTETTLERWEIRGKLPCSVDDLVRSIAVRDERIVAAGHVGLAAIHINDEPRRGFFVEVERSGRRGRWMLPIPREGDPLPADFAGMAVELGPVPEGEQPWLGVEPAVQMNFEMLGFVDGLGGPVIAEA